MTVDRANPWAGDSFGTTCTFGHEVQHSSLMIFSVDGHPVCIDHAFELADAIESVRKAPEVSAVEITRASHDRDVRIEHEARVTEMRKQGENVAGFVYYIQMDRHIKIGFALDVTKRMRAYPPSAVLLAIHPGTKKTEKQMHDQFHAYLDRGREWFDQGKSLMAHIDQVRERFGDPAGFSYSFTKSHVNGS